MKILVLFCLQLTGVILTAQPFNGLWTGVISRDINNVNRTDSIRLQLEQDGNSITGFSLLKVDSIHFIKAAIKGEYVPSNQVLRLTEISVMEMNIPDRDEEIILDRYLLNYDGQKRNELSGKCIPGDNRQHYGRSVIRLHRY